MLGGLSFDIEMELIMERSFSLDLGVNRIFEGQKSLPRSRNSREQGLRNDA